jgi:cardiolipin synthase
LHLASTVSLFLSRRLSLLLLGAVACLAIVIGLGLLFAQDQRTLRLRSQVAADDPRAPAYLAALVGAEVSHGNLYEVLTDGARTFAAMIEAIDGARRRVSFETYVYENGKVAERFTEALERAAQRGVRVRVVVDAIGAARMDEAHVERLRRAGCEVVSFNPTSWQMVEEVNYRTHRKILVVDGEVGFTGGIGVADYWLGDGEDPPWRDTHVRLRGPLVQRLEGAFYDNFLESGEVVTPELDGPPPAPLTIGTGADSEVTGMLGTADPPGPIEATGTDGAGDDAAGGSSMLIRSSPTGGTSDLKRLYLLAIGMARRTIDVASPYFLLDESSFWSFEDAVSRGVRVRVLVESELTDARPVKYASRAAYDRLLSHGVEIYEYQPTMMHAKVMVVDGVLSIFGSANFDNRSLELNDELSIAVAGPALGARLLADFEADLERARRIDLSTWRQRPAHERVRERFWGYFAEVF